MWDVTKISDEQPLGERLDWQYSKPGTAPFVHLRHAKRASLTSRLGRSSPVRRVVARAFGVWPPPTRGDVGERPMQVTSVDGSHHPDALVYVCSGDARRVFVAQRDHRVWVALGDELGPSIRMSGVKNDAPVFDAVPVSRREDAWEELARRAPPPA